MNVPTRLSEIRDFVIARGFHPSRQRGQNFLIDRNILTIMLDQSGVGNGDRVLEIGPGLGILTDGLLQRGAQVVAIEKDRRLCGFLREFFMGESRFTLIEGDALDQDLGALFDSGIESVVANLPYSSGSRMLVDMCWTANAPARLCVTVQREVAERLAGEPGGRQCGLLTVLCGYRYDCRIVHEVSSTCFWPRPSVGSAVVLMDRMRPPLPPPAEFCYRHLTHYAFRHRRKQISGIFARGAEPFRLSAETCRRWLLSVGLPETARPEDLSALHWRTLALTLTLNGNQCPAPNTQFNLKTAVQRVQKED